MFAGQAAGAAPEPGQYQPAGHSTVLVVAPPAQKMPAEQAAGAAPPPVQKKPGAHGTVLFVAPGPHWMPGEQLTQRERWDLV